jgi:hypothetical protein
MSAQSHTKAIVMQHKFFHFQSKQEHFSYQGDCADRILNASELFLHLNPSLQLHQLSTPHSNSPSTLNITEFNLIVNSADTSATATTSDPQRKLKVDKGQYRVRTGHTQKQ